MTQNMRRRAILVGSVLGSMLLGCGDLTGSQSLPSGTADPNSYATPQGARAMRNAAVVQFQLAIPIAIGMSGLLTDELQDPQAGAGPGVLQTGTVPDPVDERILPATSDAGTEVYGRLQSIREYANQAIGALAAFDTIPADTASARVLRGELYAYEGYAEVLLADLFCSGVPLSTLDFQGDYTLRGGSTTDQVYVDAIAKFDTAITLATGVDSILDMARVGKGRALLDRGQYAEAAEAVQSVPLDFQYQTTSDWYGACGVIGGGCINSLVNQGSVPDREGFNGLPYRSSGDPRTTVISATNAVEMTVWFPTKYQASLADLPGTPVVLASGTEAALIRAEAALQANDASWLQTLNDLRATIGLSPLADPGTAAGRITLLFTERAYWLFMTAHRQGDLRRLVRSYGPTNVAFRDQSLVYPTGNYTAPGTGVYGSDVTLPIPATEQSNPLFHGCVNRGA
jgi:hypothetical protein